MRILITGGFGYIGGRLGQYLHGLGHEVVLGTRKSGQTPFWLPQAEVVQTHWHDDQALVNICNGADVVVHAAGMNARDCAVDPVKALEFNGLGTARLVKASIKAKVSRFVYLSTAHVYASPLVGDITEHTCPRNLHPYATSHLAGENVVCYAANQGLIDGLVLRLSNAYGKPAHPDANCWTLLVNDLCRQAVERSKLVLRTRGLDFRDFLPVSRACDLIGRLVFEYAGIFEQSVLNIGSGKSEQVKIMAEKVQERCVKVLGFKPRLMRPKTAVDVEKDWTSPATNCLEYKSLFISESWKDSSADREIDTLLLACSDWFEPLAS